MTFIQRTVSTKLSRILWYPSTITFNGKLTEVTRRINWAYAYSAARPVRILSRNFILHASALVNVEVYYTSFFLFPVVEYCIEVTRLSKLVFISSEDQYRQWRLQVLDKLVVKKKLGQNMNAHCLCKLCIGTGTDWGEWWGHYPLKGTNASFPLGGGAEWQWTTPVATYLNSYEKWAFCSILLYHSWPTYKFLLRSRQTLREFFCTSTWRGSIKWFVLLWNCTCSLLKLAFISINGIN